MIKLFDFELSANCYKQRLLMAILGIEHEPVHVDFYPGWEHKGATFREINPLGHIPVIDDDGFILRDAHAILVYLATKYDPTDRWYPTGDAALLGEVAQWMSFADGTAGTASAARLHDSFNYPFDVEACRGGAHDLFEVLDEHLWHQEEKQRPWICSAAHPTVADLAVFPDVMLSEEGHISRRPYPAIRRWTDRVKQIDGFVPMPGIFPAHRAPDSR